MSDYRLKDRPLVQSGIQPEIDAGIPTEGAAEARASAHPTLAARIAQLGRLRAERAALLARLRHATTSVSTPEAPPDPTPLQRRIAEVIAHDDFSSLPIVIRQRHRISAGHELRDAGCGVRGAGRAGACGANLSARSGANGGGVD